MPAWIYWQMWPPWSVGDGQTGFLSPWSKEPWGTELRPSLAYAASAVFSGPEAQTLGICRSDANLNKPQMFLSASQRVADVESVLHCCDCKAGLLACGRS